MKAFIEKGVTIIHPESTWIDDSVSPDRISSSATIHPGCRISGAATSIGPDCVLGEEAPATVNDCQLGASVALKGGSFSNSVFLDGVSVGSSAHIRPNCLLEEQSSCGHAVGLKQTVLLPFVALGSLINFCDCLMAGGTDRRNHSEVGSSYVHFNYSPRRHKATPSAFGDVPRGVMLDQSPIFLGGQGGAVGPLQVAFGTLTAAGTILRRDVTTAGQLVSGGATARLHQHSFNADAFGDSSKAVHKNILYLGGLHALRAWYREVRSKFVGSDYQANCHAAAIDCLSGMIGERLNRLSQMAARVKECSSPTMSTYDADQAFVARCNETCEKIGAASTIAGDTRRRDEFLAAMPSSDAYLPAVKGLTSTVKAAGSDWLDSVVLATSDIWRG